MAEEKTYAEVAPTFASAGVKEEDARGQAAPYTPEKGPAPVEIPVTKEILTELLSYFRWHGESYVPAPHDKKYGGRSLEQAAASVGLTPEKVKALYEEFKGLRAQEAAKAGGDKPIGEAGLGDGEVIP